MLGATAARGQQRGRTHMAVVVEVVVARGSQTEFDGVDVAVSSAMERSGPPAGLMSHLVKPVGDGFVISDVWRSAQDFDPFWVDVLRPRWPRRDSSPAIRWSRRCGPSPGHSRNRRVRDQRSSWVISTVTPSDSLRPPA